MLSLHYIKILRYKYICFIYIKTRMKTSTSSEALSQLGAEKIAFSPKPDGHLDGCTDRQTYGYTDRQTDGYADRQTDGHK